MTYTDFQNIIRVQLDPQQETAVRAAEGPVLLLAVPGSGKTTVLVTRLGYMIHCLGVAPESILTMTYTVAATADMRQRFSSFFGEELGKRLEFRTINGVSARIIQLYERAFDRTAFRLVTDERILSNILADCYRKHNQGFVTDSVLRAIRTQITYIKNKMLSDEEIEKIQIDEIQLAPIYRDYCRILREQGLMDYDDQMVYAHQILLRHPQILQMLQQQYCYFCVDEAQDTSKIQHCIIRQLAGGSGNLFMVGDEDQSIYGFRAAYPEALMSFEKDYPGAKILLMERNYRSSAQIVSAADRFIRQNRERHAKSMISIAGPGMELGEIPVFDRDDQYTHLLEIARNCQKETAVLYRNNESALPVIDLLEREGIPYRCRQFDSSFFSNRIVQDITDIIHFSFDPTDGALFLRVYYKLNAGISKVSAEYAVEHAHGRPILEALLDQSELPQRTKIHCKALQTHFANLSGEKPDRAIYRITRFMGYGEYLDQRGMDQTKLEILEAVAHSEPTLLRFLTRLEELSEIVRMRHGDDDCRFILSTIHSSKGLEYDRVILMDVIDGIFPNTDLAQDAVRTEDERKALEEERRLFYVGMTRARRELQVFRFRRPSVAATFSEDIFPQKSAPPPKSKPMLKKQEPTERPECFMPEIRVVHKQFGSGIIVSKQGDIATISFDSGEERRFSLHTALRRGQLRLD